MWAKGMEPSKTNQTRRHNTFTPSLHLVPFCQLRIPQNSLTLTLAYSHPLNLHINKALSTAHSTVFHIQNNQYLPCSAATKVHSMTDTPTCHADSVLLMYSTVQKWYILISPTLNLPTKWVLCHFAYSFLSNVLCGFQVF